MKVYAAGTSHPRLMAPTTAPTMKPHKTPSSIFIPLSARIRSGVRVSIGPPVWVGIVCRPRGGLATSTDGSEGVSAIYHRAWCTEPVSMNKQGAGRLTAPDPSSDLDWLTGPLTLRSPGWRHASATVLNVLSLLEQIEIHTDGGTTEDEHRLGRDGPASVRIRRKLEAAERLQLDFVLAHRQ